MSRDIAVVLVTDNTVDQWDGSRPVSLARHARALEAILEAGPKAVMVDFRFGKARPGEYLREFDDAIATATLGNIPLLFSKGMTGNGYESLPEPLTALGTVTGWTGDAKQIPLLLPPDGRHGEGHAGEHGGEAQPTAPFLLYERLCNAHALANCPARVRREAFQERLAIRYGLEQNPDQHRVIPADCPGFGGGFWQRMGHMADLVFNAIIPRLQHVRGVAQPCPTLLTLNAEDLERTMPEADGALMLHMLAGRVVFYGGDLRGEHDVVDVPFRGEIAGTTMLASTFENLDLYGERYFKQPPRLLEEPIEINIGDIAEAIIWTVLVVALVLHHDRPEALGRFEQRTKFLARPLLAAVVVLLLACLAWTDLGDWKTGRLPADFVAGKAVLYAMCCIALTCIALGWGWLTTRPLGRLLQLSAVTALLFICNEVWLRWPNGDWVGLVLLFLALGEAVEGKPGSVVNWLESKLVGGGRNGRAPEQGERE